MLAHIFRRSLLLAFFSFLIPISALAAGEYILLARYDGTPGDSFDVRGYGFEPYGAVTVTFEGTTLSTTADGGGNFASPAFTVPFRLPGEYEVKATQTHHQAQGKIYINGYYPWGGASTYYVLPGQPLGFYGRHFAPGEHVKLFDGAGTLIHTFTADGGGSFDTSNTIAAIPWSWKGTAVRYRMEGQMTKAVSTFQVVIGDFYVNIIPSSYYVAFHSPMTVEARNFAPSEPVDLFLNGSKVDTRTADGGGNLLFNITAPGRGMSFDLRGKGQWSGAETTRTVTLAQPGWGM